MGTHGSQGRSSEAQSVSQPAALPPLSLPPSLLFSLYPGPQCGCEDTGSSESALKIAIGTGRWLSSKAWKMLPIKPAPV